MKLLFIKSNSFAGLFIRWFTWSKWNHVAIVLDDETLVHATAANGVCIQPISEVIEQAGDFEFAEVSGDPAIALDHVGKPYDWGAVFGIRWGAWDNPDKWFCSELAALCTGEFRPDALNRVSPKHVYMITR